MSLYAAPEHLAEAAAFYQVPLPAQEAQERLLRLAERDVERFLGWRPAEALGTLTARQLEALRDATCAQACFRIEQGPILSLGSQDDVAAAGDVQFSLRDIPRLSAEAVEHVSGLGLIRRVPMATDPVPPAA